MDSTCSYDCSFSLRHRKLEPYADVAGPGVIAGFLGTAWICVVLVLIHYVLVFDPHQDPFHQEGLSIADDDAGGWVANPIDVMFKSVIHRTNATVGASRRPGVFGWMMRDPRWQKAFDKAILAMCDVQILTGFGILVSGYADLKCGISAYHFQLIGFIAWFSSLTHTAGLTILRQYLHPRPFEKWVRLTLMAVLAVMLLTAMGPTVFFDWNYKGSQLAVFPGSNAICFFDTRLAIDWLNVTSGVPVSALSSFQSVLISMLLLSFGLFSRTIKLVSSLSSTAMRTRSWSSSYHKKFLLRLYRIHPPYTGRGRKRPRLWVWRFLFFPQIVYLLVGRIYLDLLTSNLSDIYWLIVSAIWGTIKLFQAKYSAQVEEHSWGFGQILPVFLLIAPLPTIAKFLAEASEADIPANTLPSTDRTVASDGESAYPETILPPEVELDMPDNDMPIEMRRFQQYVHHSLTRDYYHRSTCLWMLPAVVLACLQILAITISFFSSQVSDADGKSAFAVVGIYSYAVLLVSPSACYLYVSTCLLFEHFFPVSRPWHRWVVCVLMAIFALYGLYPIWSGEVGNTVTGMSIPFSAVTRHMDLIVSAIALSSYCWVGSSYILSFIYMMK